VANQNRRGEKAVKKRFNPCVECACSEFFPPPHAVFPVVPFQLPGYGSILEYPSLSLPAEARI